MSLEPGYNIVTEYVAETDNELAVLEFFRRTVADEEIEAPVTVIALENLLYDAEEEARPSIITTLRQTLRNTSSLTPMDAVQFYIDGQLVTDIEFRVRIERSGEGVYLDIGQIFVEEPKFITSTQAVARK